MILLSWKFRLASGHFGLLMSLNQQEKKGVAVLPGVIDVTMKGKLSCYYARGVRRRASGIQVIFCLMTKVSGKSKVQLARLWPIPFENENVDQPTGQRNIISWSIY